jgi:creatinine amidohydrolase
MAEKKRMAHCTWKEVEELGPERTPVLIPVGATENYGPHLPLGSDHIYAEAVALAVAERAGGLVAPTLPFGYSHYFQKFPGTITLKPETLKGLVIEVIECLSGQGFRTFLLVNTHMGNVPTLEHAAREAMDRLPVRVALADPWRVANVVSADLLETEDQPIGHASELGTSVISHLAPEAVRPDLKTKGTHSQESDEFRRLNPSRVLFDRVEYLVFDDARKLNPTGVSGDPFLGNKEKGEKIFDLVADHIARFFEAWLQVKGAWSSSSGS